MAYHESNDFNCVEALRDQLFRHNRDLAEKCTYGAPLLQTIGEITALMGIPVDLTLTHEQLVSFIWDLVKLLHRRATIMIAGGKEEVSDSIIAVQDELLSDVLQEYATGIIVTQDEIVTVAAGILEAVEAVTKVEYKEVELLPETKQKQETAKKGRVLH